MATPTAVSHRSTPLGLGLLALLVACGLARAQADPPAGRLQVKAMLVAADLSLRPVPKKGLLIRSAADPDATRTVTTGFSGEVEVDLPPGAYTLSLDAPLEFEGRTLTWEVAFDIQAGATTTVELSNDNARFEEAGPPPVRGQLSEAEIYRQVRAAVFKVLSERGHGSGFLVDTAGLVLTNHHVVVDSEYLAVKVDEERKYPAVLVADDPTRDLAILRVHPGAVAGVSALPLADDSPATPPLIIGERVVAIGSPLATETILTGGLVSKIEEGALFSDVNINPGNSGGPLFKLTGEVVGVNTFGLFAEAGPGVSGIVRIHLARPLLARARETMAQTPPPPETLLPEAASFRFPPEELSKIAVATRYDARHYHVEAGKIDVQFLTPVVLAQLEIQAEKEAAEFRKRRTRRKQDVQEYVPGRDFYEWRRYAGDYRPVVRIQAIPEIGLTGGSLFAVVMLGPNVPKTYKFKTDFKRMELVRGNAVIEPIHPGRIPHVANIEAGADRLKDLTFWGAYEYPPEAFKPGVAVVLKVWQEGKPQPVVRMLDGKLQQRIWDDFAPYFAALEVEGGQ